MVDVYFGATQLKLNARLVAMYAHSGVSDAVIEEEYGSVNGHTVRLMSVWYLPHAVYAMSTHDLLIGDTLNDEVLKNGCTELAEAVRVRDGLRAALAVPAPDAVQMRRTLHTHFLAMELYARLARCGAGDRLRVLLPEDMQWRSVYHGNRHQNYDVDSVWVSMSYVSWTHCVRDFHMQGPVPPSADPIGLRVRSVPGTPASGVHVCGGAHAACGILGVIHVEEVEPSVPQLLLLLGCAVVALNQMTPSIFTYMVNVIMYARYQCGETEAAVCVRLQHSINTSERATYGLMRYVDAIKRHFGFGPDVVDRYGMPVWFPHALFEDDGGRMQVFEGVLQMTRRIGDVITLGCIALGDADGDDASYVLHRTLFTYIAALIAESRFGFLGLLGGRDVVVIVYMIAQSGVCKMVRYEVPGADVVALYWDMMDKAAAVMRDRLLVMRQPALLPSSKLFRESVVGQYMFGGQEDALEDASFCSVVIVPDIDLGSGGSVRLRMCATTALSAGVTTRGRLTAASRLYFWCYDPLPAVVAAAIDERVASWLLEEPGSVGNGHSPSRELDEGARTPDDGPVCIADDGGEGSGQGLGAGSGNGVSSGGGQGAGAGSAAAEDDDDATLEHRQATRDDLARHVRLHEPLVDGLLYGFPYVNAREVRDMAYGTVDRIQTYDELAGYIPNIAAHTDKRHRVNGLVQAIVSKLYRAHKIGLQVTLHRELLRVCNQHSVNAGIEKWSDDIVRDRTSWAIMMRYTHMYFNVMVQVQNRHGFYRRDVDVDVKRFGPRSQRFLMSDEGLEAYEQVEAQVEAGDEFWLRRLVRRFGCDAATQAAEWVTENATNVHFHPPAAALPQLVIPSQASLAAAPAQPQASLAAAPAFMGGVPNLRDALFGFGFSDGAAAAGEFSLPEGVRNDIDAGIFDEFSSAELDHFGATTLLENSHLFFAGGGASENGLPP